MAAFTANTAIGCRSFEERAVDRESRLRRIVDHLRRHPAKVSTRDLARLEREVRHDPVGWGVDDGLAQIHLRFPEQGTGLVVVGLGAILLRLLTGQPTNSGSTCAPSC